MAKKLFVPERMTKPKDEMPPAIEKAFDQHDEDTKNNEDPSKMEASALERLPQPVGYRLLVIPYYMKAKTQRLADGAVETIQDYRFIVGQVRGLTQCEDLIRAAMKGVELEDG